MTVRIDSQILRFLLRCLSAVKMIIVTHAGVVKRLSRAAPGRLLLYDFGVSINQRYYSSKSCIKQIWLVNIFPGAGGGGVVGRAGFMGDEDICTPQVLSRRTPKRK